MTPEFRCYLCAGRDGRLVANSDAKTRERLRVKQCAKCGLVQQFPLPDSRDLHVYYSHHYRLDYKRVHQPRAKHVHRAGIAALARIDFLAEAGIRAGRLIDVGAGGGEFVFMAGRKGFQASGVEPNLGYSAFARDAYDVSVQTAEVGSLQGSSADVITMFHVLEHIADPRAALESIWQALTPDGHLFIEVPNITAADASPHNIYFKAHLFYFSAATLAALAHVRFELVASDDRGNLRMLLRRRETPAQARLPEPAAVQDAHRRLDEKGWLEYMTRGRGWRKPISRWRRHRVEAGFDSVGPRDILNSLIV
ncbi:MAG: methyltransferase domain-containing protein [Burkholderiaceae bacterium]